MQRNPLNTIYERNYGIARLMLRVLYHLPDDDGCQFSVDNIVFGIKHISCNRGDYSNLVED